MRETKNRIFNKMLLTIYLAGAINPKALFFGDTPYCNHVRQRLQKAIQDGYVKEYSYAERYGTHLRDYSYLAITAARANALYGAVPNNGQYRQGFRLRAGDIYIFDGTEMLAGQIFNWIWRWFVWRSHGERVQFLR